MSTIIRGDDEKWFVRLFDADGVPFDLTGCTVWITGKTAKSNDADDADALYTHTIVIDGAGAVTSSDGISLGGTDPDTGTAYTLATEGALTQHLADTESTLLAAGTIVYDVQLKDAAGEIHTILQDSDTVVEDVTRRITTP
jgi:hypothetical protein